MRQLEGEIQKWHSRSFWMAAAATLAAAMQVSIERVGVVLGTWYNAFLKVKNLRKVVNDGKGCGPQILMS